MTKGVTTARLANGQLIIGGRFTKVGTVARGGLASLDPTTGALTNYLTAGVSGHHNYGHLSAAELAARPPWPIDPTPAKGDPGILQLAINPQGTRMVVIGDFDTAGGLARDQIAVYGLTPTGGAVDPSWATQRYGDACFWWSFDAYTHDVDFAPDGNSFEVAAEGGRELPRAGEHHALRHRRQVGCQRARHCAAADLGPGLRQRQLLRRGRHRQRGLRRRAPALRQQPQRQRLRRWRRRRPAQPDGPRPGQRHARSSGTRVASLEATASCRCSRRRPGSGSATTTTSWATASTPGAGSPSCP